VNGESPAAAELHVLLGHPTLAGRWPQGFTSDDVLDALRALGRIRIDVRDGLPDEVAAPAFACTLELRDETAGAIFGEGHSLTAAALRCMIEAEAEVAAEVERGLGELRDLLGER
jgi:hypothetical protein